MASPSPKATVAEFVADFDGDGFVASAEIVRDLSPHPYVRLTLNSGCHATMLDLRAADLGHLCSLLETARKANMKALVAK